MIGQTLPLRCLGVAKRVMNCATFRCVSRDLKVNCMVRFDMYLVLNQNSILKIAIVSSMEKVRFLTRIDKVRCEARIGTRKLNFEICDSFVRRESVCFNQN